MTNFGNQPAGPTTDAPHARRRTFIDTDGNRWHVYELPSSDYDRRHGVSLIFASDATMRRVRSFPSDWEQLSDAELLRLSWAT